MWHRLYTYLGLRWADLATLSGLVFSILATIFSKRAARAAREARDLALSKSLAEDLNDAGRTAQDALSYVELDHGDLAALRAADLVRLTTYIFFTLASPAFRTITEPVASSQGTVA